MADSRSSYLPHSLRTVFLDRDGVLNRKLPEGRYVTSPNELELLPGVALATARFNRAGVRVIVVSNQRGIALGLYKASDVRRIHDALQSQLKAHAAHVDAFYICPHDEGQCNCRKPLGGMYEQARAEFPEIAAESSAMIGDSGPDIEFGRRLGMRTIWIEGDAQLRKPGGEAARELADLHAGSLLEAADTLLAGLVRVDQTG